MTILVTGGAGFIGGHFVEHILAETGLQVVTLDLLTYAGSLANLPIAVTHPRHTFVHGDLANRQLVGDLLAEHRPTSVVHFAAETHVDRSISAPVAFAATNVLGTVELLTATRTYWSSLDSPARGRFRFVHVSTDEVYGSIEQGVFDERSPYAPNSPYAASKAAADHFVRAFHHTYGLPVLTTQGSNTYGPAQYPEKLVPLMILNALEGLALPVYGDGGNIRDWLHVSDHVRAIELVLTHGEPGGVYPIGGGAERTNLQLVQAIIDKVGHLAGGRKRSEIQFVADRPGHDRRYAVDSRSVRALGWVPKVELDPGLEQTVRWYRDNSAWVERISARRPLLLP